MSYGMGLSEGKSAARILKATIISISAVVGAVLVMGFFPSQAHLLLLGMAFLLIYMGGRSIAYYLRTRKWVPAGARICGIREDWIDVSLRYSKLRYFYPSIEYEYTFRGNDYRSNTVSFEIENIWVPELDQWGIKTNSEAKFWNGWQNGKSITVHVNPDMPFESVVVKEISRKHRSQGIAMIAGGVLIGLFWFFLRI